MGFRNPLRYCILLGAPHFSRCTLPYHTEGNLSDQSDFNRHFCWFTIRT